MMRAKLGRAREGLAIGRAQAELPAVYSKAMRWRSLFTSMDMFAIGSGLANIPSLHKASKFDHAETRLELALFAFRSEGSLMYKLIVAYGCLVLLPDAAWAQEREYCPDRPGIGTPACTMAPGRASLEVGLGDWSVDSTSDERQDVFLTGDAVLRYGIADHAELQLGWTMLGFARRRDRLTGTVDHRSGIGDATLALRRNLAHPDGSGFSLAVMPYASLPVGREPFGEGDWSAGMRVPVSLELSQAWSVAATTSFDAAVDEDGSGRHFALEEVVGAQFKLSKAVSVTAEYAFTFDRDPADHHTENLGGLSLAWQPADDLQLDLGSNVALDHHARDAQVYFGVSRRF
jgi:outer membrane putative beta-barrel porin/alpha-amylase